MTPQEIDRIQNAINHIKTSVDIDPWAMEIAIEALEKHVPMETAPEELGITAMSPIITPCGNCGMELTDRMWDFCPWCGQKIKWRRNQHDRSGKTHTVLH